MIKILYPTGYQIKDLINDNIDIHIIFPNGDVFFGTLFTIDNIKSLISKDSENYFWSTNMVIVKNLGKEEIHNSIEMIIKDGYFDQVFTKIGTIETIYSENKSFENLV